MLAAHPLAFALLATALLSGVLLAIARIDAATLRIPDALSLPLIGLGLLWAALQAQPVWPQHLIGAIMGFVTLALIGEVYFRRTGHEGLGLGDAKLFAASGAWLGWQALPQVLLIAACAGLIFALWRKPQPGQPGAAASGQPGAAASGQPGAAASGRLGTEASGPLAAAASGPLPAAASGPLPAAASGPLGAVAFGPWLALGFWLVWLWQTFRPLA